MSALAHQSVGVLLKVSASRKQGCASALVNMLARSVKVELVHQSAQVTDTVTCRWGLVCALEDTLVLRAMKRCVIEIAGSPQVRESATQRLASVYVKKAGGKMDVLLKCVIRNARLMANATLIQTSANATKAGLGTPAV